MIRLSTPEAIQQVAMPGGWTLTMRTVDAPAFDMARRRASAAAVALMASEETRARYGLSADDVAPLKAHLDATTGHEDLADQARGVVFGAGIHMLAVEIANAHAIGWTGVVDDEGEEGVAPLAVRAAEESGPVLEPDFRVFARVVPLHSGFVPAVQIAVPAGVSAGL